MDENPLITDDRQFHSALDHAEALVNMLKGSDKELAIELRNRIMLPMAAVLDKVKGKTVKAKAAHAGVSRQTFYDWKNGVNRPTPNQARKLAQLTRIGADKIMGRKR